MLSYFPKPMKAKPVFKVLVNANTFDFLIIAAGMQSSYFGHDEFAKFSPALKNLNDAETIRSKILSAYELAELTDGLVRVFSNPLGAVRRLRNLGLLAFDLLPPAKSALSRLSTGGGGRIPKLARGVALT